MNLVVTKIDAARRQLHSAIELWFSEGDPVSVHSLASNAHQIVHDLNHNAGHDPLLLDQPDLTKEQRKLFAQVFKFDSNFFKHADRGAAGQVNSIEFNPFANEVLISIAIQGLKQMGHKLTPYEVAFFVWESIHRPELLNDAAIDMLGKVTTAEGLASLRKIERGGFLKSVLASHGHNDA